VTVKCHGTESHLVQQMRTAPGGRGLSEFDESWGEQYHQTGYALDTRLRNQGGELRKAKFRVSNDRRENRPETQAALKRKREATSKGKSEKTVEKEAARKKVKQERREASLQD
jgi:hypothetical protein